MFNVNEKISFNEIGGYSLLFLILTKKNVTFRKEKEEYGIK